MQIKGAHAIDLGGRRYNTDKRPHPSSSNGSLRRSEVPASGAAADQAGRETWPMREAGACQALAGEEKPPSEMRAERRGAAPQAMPRRPEPVHGQSEGVAEHAYVQARGRREGGGRKPGGSCRPTRAVQPKQREGRHPRCKSRREGEREVPGSSTADARRHVG